MLIANMTHPLVTSSSRIDTLNQCAARGLGLQKVSHVSYRVLDYWMYHLPTLQDMMMYVQKQQNMPFLNAYVMHPAGEPIYYGMYQMHKHPHNSTHRVKFVSVPELFIQNGLTPRAKLNHELAHSIWTCKTSKIWTFEEKLSILNTHLDYIRGWRFDHLPRNGCSEVSKLFTHTRNVTWATSNYQNQLNVHRSFHSHDAKA